MKDTEYVYAVTAVKLLENQMLRKQDLAAVVAAESLSAAKKMLSERGYRELSEVPVSEALKLAMERTWREVLAVCPEEAPLEILLYQNDFHNLKTILKAGFSDAKWEPLMKEPSQARPIRIAEAVKTKQFDNLPSFLQKPAEEAYRLLAEHYDGQLAEVYLDREAYLAMRARAQKEKSEFLHQWCERNILVADFKIALRTNRRGRAFLELAMIPSELAGEGLFLAACESREAVLQWMERAGYPAEAAKNDPIEFDRWCSAFLMDGLSEAKRSFFGFEPIMAFLLGKQAEICAVRIILSGKQNGLSEEKIKERLRECYV